MNNSNQYTEEKICKTCKNKFTDYLLSQSKDCPDCKFNKLPALNQTNDAHGVDNSYHKMIKPKRTIKREQEKKLKGKRKFGFK